MLMPQIMMILVGSLASLGAYQVIRRLVIGGRSLRLGRAPAVEEDRLLRIEQTLESLSVEMERVSEAQRFTSRLLMERLPERQADQLSARTPARVPGSITPH